MEAKAETRNVFLRCLQLLLRPAMKFCHSRGLKIGDILECAKATYIEVAAEDLEKRLGQNISISRLSLITGIQRPEVARIYKRKEIGKNENNIPVKVIGRWKQSTEYTTEKGEPRILSVEGNESEFCRLVRSVNSHMNPYTVLFELERIKAVERTSAGLKLNTAIYTPTGDIEEGSRLMCSDAEDLMEAVEENLKTPDSPPNYHLVTEYNNINEESLPLIKDWIHNASVRFHAEAQEFLAKHDIDVNPGINGMKGNVRVIIGGFSRIIEPFKPAFNRPLRVISKKPKVDTGIVD